MTLPQPLRDPLDHSTLEAVSGADPATNYKYSVPNSTAPCMLDGMGGYHEHPGQSAYSKERPGPHNPGSRRPLKRWLVVISYCTFIAVASGIIGGVIGKAIADNAREKDSTTQPQDQSPKPSSCPLNGTATDTPRVFQRTIPIASTGCASSDTDAYLFPHVVKETSTYLSVPYSTICDAGWNHDELFAMSAATPSDCIEACFMYNLHRNATTERNCVGGGFIPAWWNQTKAMDESRGTPYNCFLKSNSSGIAKNDRSIEVVSLCVSDEEGSCVDARLI